MSPRARAAAFWLCASLNAVPLLFTRHLPFCDLPEHVAAIATLAHWFDPVWRSQEYFTLAGILRTQYWLYHAVGALLAVVLGSAERANLVLLAITAVGFPASMRALLRALDRDERYALAAAPFFWSRALANGLLNYVAAIPLLLWGLSLAVRQARAPTGGRAAALVALSLAILFLHLSAFVVFIGGAVLVAFFLGARVGMARRLWWCAPSLGVLALTMATSTVTHAAAQPGLSLGTVRYAPLGYKLRQLPLWLHDIWQIRAENFAAAIWWGLLVVVVARRTDVGGGRARRLGAALLAMTAVLYLAMPSQVGFAFVLDVRLAPLFGLFALLLIPAARAPLDRLAATALALASLAIATTAAVELRRFEREEAYYFEDLIRNLPPGKRMLSLIFDQRSQVTPVSPFMHFGSYYRARNGGVASFSYSEVPHWPIQYRPEAAPPKKSILFWDWTPCLYRNLTDGPYFDYVLTRGSVDPFAAHPPGPRWTLIGAARSWKLFQKQPGSWQSDGEDVGPCVRPGAG